MGGSEVAEKLMYDLDTLLRVDLHCGLLRHDGHEALNQHSRDTNPCPLRCAL